MRHVRSLAVLALLAALVPLPAAGWHGPAAYVDLAPCAAADDAGSGRDASPDDPVAVAPGSHAACVDAGEIDPQPYEGVAWDVFTFAVGEGERVRVGLAAASGCEADDRWHFQMYLAPPGHPEWASASMTTDVCRQGHVGATGYPAGAWTVRVVAWPNAASPRHSAPVVTGTGAYTLLVETGAVAGYCDPQDDAGSGGDGARASPVAVGPGLLEGCLDQFDHEDAYAFPVAAGDRVLVRLKTPDCRYTTIYVGGPAAAWSDWSHVSADACDWLEASTVATADGVLQTWLREFGGEMRYQIDIQVGPAIGRACGPAHEDAASGRDSAWSDPVFLPTGRNGACLDEFDQLDGYAFPVEGGEYYGIFLHTTVCRHFYVEVRHSVDGLLSAGEQDTCDTAAWSAFAQSDGDVTVKVSRWWGDGAYEIERRPCLSDPPWRSLRYYPAVWCAVEDPAASLP